MESPVTCSLCDSLGSNDGDFLQNTDEAKKNHARIHFLQSKILDDGITEDDILQRCFTTRKPKRGRPASGTKCRQTLLDLCTSLRKHHTKSVPVICNVCGVGISVKQSKQMLHHACAHLDVKLFKCRHCDCCTSSKGNCVLYHLRRVHNILKPTKEDFEDKTIECFDEISKRIKCCFSTNYPRASGLQRQFVITNCQDKKQRSVVNLCRSIFLQRSKPSSLECNICGSRIITQHGGQSFQGQRMLQHAAAHLDVKLFTCRHCNHRMSTKSGTKQHLRNVHQIIRETKHDFDDHSEECHFEYMRMIERCFSKDQVKLEVSGTKGISTLKSEAAVRGHTSGSMLTVQRHLFCNRLIRKSIDSDGKNKCSLCSKRLAIKSRGVLDSKVAFNHVGMHLQKPLYRCKVCRNPFSTHQAVLLHLRRKHALGMEKNHECMADEFHDDIMAMLSKCFASDGL